MHHAAALKALTDQLAVSRVLFWQTQRQRDLAARLMHQPTLTQLLLMRQALLTLGQRRGRVTVQVPAVVALLTSSVDTDALSAVPRLFLRHPDLSKQLRYQPILTQSLLMLQVQPMSALHTVLPTAVLQLCAVFQLRMLTLQKQLHRFPRPSAGCLDLA